MIYVEDFVKFLQNNKINFFSGVPDSCLKLFTSYLDKFKKGKNLIATNEGSAVSLGIGYYLSTKKVPLIYMQNSGLGNAINPLISIAHKKVYSIPLLLMIGWRGSKHNHDEPQHQTKGKITPQLLKLLNVSYCVLRKKKDLIKLQKLIKKARHTKKTVACLIEKNVLKKRKKYLNKIDNKYNISREIFISEFLRLIPHNTRIISTTGYTSRELAQIRNEKKLLKGKDFYMVGGMGHSSMVSLGYSLHSNKQVVCLDGDGSLLMHFGSLRNIAYYANPNLKHILLNNDAHESVGGQVTSASGIDFKSLVRSLGYKNYFKILHNKEINLILKKFLRSKGPSFLEVFISQGTLDNLLRINNLIKIKDQFMK
jgi:phosphonopyruvate decarboxylase